MSLSISWTMRLTSERRCLRCCGLTASACSSLRLDRTFLILPAETLALAQRNRIWNFHPGMAGRDLDFGASTRVCVIESHRVGTELSLAAGQTRAFQSFRMSRKFQI